jgi:hypothetical protein
MIQKISKHKGKLNFGPKAKVRKNASKKGVKKIGSNSKGNDRIRIPFYVYPLKDHSVCYEFDEGRKGNKRLTIRSQSTPFLYQDFEVLKKIKSGKSGQQASGSAFNQ